MKTNTRVQILEVIEKSGKIRPFDLRKSLDLSAQAIHRHLKILSEEGLIEAKGSAPFTEYALAGIPDLDAMTQWLKASANPQGPTSLICETREAFVARLSHLKLFVRDGLPVDLLPLVIATVGEIGNNSFDHNLGQWRDVPGCWFESQATGRHLWVCVADRGQGLYQSLIKVHPQLGDEQAVLHAAFETIITGRSPEQRGNGLKFVTGNLSLTPGSGVACMSGSARVLYGEEGKKCAALLEKSFTDVKGTITLMTWRLQ